MAARNTARTARPSQKDMFGSELYQVKPTAGEEAAELAYIAPIVSLRIIREQTIEVTEQIKSPSDAYRILRERLGQADREHMVAICLDTKNRVLGVDVCFIGSLNSAMITMRECFKMAMILGSAAVIFAHNHPSGQPDPSPEDVMVTRQLVDAGKLLDIEVLDSMVICADRFVSLRERGLGFTR